MPTQKKIDLVEELREKFSRCMIAVATDYTNLDVSTMTQLRLQMREKNVEYRIVKNTLAYLGADSADRPEIKDIITGPTGLAFGYDDPIGAAKALQEYIRVNRSALTIRGAVLDRRILTADEVTTLCNLPPKPELVAQLLGQVQAPLAGLLGQLQAPLHKLLMLLNSPLTSLAMLLQQRAEQLKSQEDVG
jgi:large subunit ribosomal protein L10